MVDHDSDPVQVTPVSGPGTSGARVLFVGACGVVVVAGLRGAGSVLVPFALALFLAVLTLPITIWLQSKRVPSPLAILVGVLTNVALLGLIVLLGATSLDDLQTQYPQYTTRFFELWYSWIDALQVWVPALGELDVLALDFFEPGRIVNVLGSTLQGLASFVSGTFIVLLILLFVLGEATVFPAKFLAIMGRERGSARRLRKIVHEVQIYLGIKTLVSLATGVLLGLWAWSMGLDFPVLLGVIAFLLNYVPTVGSVLASIPAMLLGLIQFDLVHALVVGSGYVAVNLIFGNIIEPNLMGRRLGLSTLVVILSLLFWGFVWGPVGMLLAVPLTMVVKIWLENTDDLRWVAILLDKGAPEATTLVRRGDGSARGGSEPEAPEIHEPRQTRETRDTRDTRDTSENPTSTRKSEPDAA